MGKVSKAKKEKKKLGAGRGENKVAKKKLRSGLRKDKQKKSTWDDTGIEKRILSVHHPRWCTGGCWFTLASGRLSYLLAR